MKRFPWGLIGLALIAFGGLGRGPSRAAGPEYAILDLGTLGGDWSQATGINAAGRVVGCAQNADRAWRAFLWDGAMHDLGTLGGDQSVAYGINAAGQVVGYAEIAAGDWHFHAFLWDGMMYDLGTLWADDQSVAYGINDAGQVVGWSTTADRGFHAFLWDGAMYDLGTLGGGTASEAWGINAAGQVVGCAQNADRAWRAFLWDGVMHDLGTLGGEGSWAYGINDAGQGVGWAETADGYEHAFLWDGVMHDLGTLGGNESEAHGINAAGQVVGWAQNADGYEHAFLWDQDHGMRDLNDLIPLNSGWELLVAGDLNEAGWIVGWGFINGKLRAFLATPVGRVVGTVTDARTGAPLAKAKVKVYNEAGEVVATTKTEADGTYALALPEDIYRLKFKKKRYRSATARDVTVTVGEDTEVDVALRRKS